MADVTSTFNSLSSTEGSNSPAGTTVIGAGLDDNLRMIQALVAAWRDQTGWAGLFLTSVAGTNTITATLATAGSVTFGPTAYATGMRFILTPANTNTGATTLNVTSPNGGSALGAKNVFMGGVACGGGELVAGVPCEVIYDGTQFNIFGATPIQTGTWVPVLTFATAGDLNVVYGVQVGSYTKIGRLVTLSGIITTSTFTFSTASGNCNITGLPFACRTLTNLEFNGKLAWRGITNANVTEWGVNLASGASLLTIVGSGSAQVIRTLTTSDTPTGGTVILHFTIQYESA